MWLLDFWICNEFALELYLKSFKFFKMKLSYDLIKKLMA